MLLRVGRHFSTWLSCSHGKGKIVFAEASEKNCSGYRCLSHTCAALFKLSCWWWVCNCVCRCVSDRILEVFAQEQKEQHPVHSPLADTVLQGELEKARASDLSQPWQWWRWLHYLLCIQRPCRVFRAVTVWGDFKRWLWACQASRVDVAMQGRQ